MLLWRNKKNIITKFKNTPIYRPVDTHFTIYYGETCRLEHTAYNYMDLKRNVKTDSFPLEIQGPSILTLGEFLL